MPGLRAEDEIRDELLWLAEGKIREEGTPRHQLTPEGGLEIEGPSRSKRRRGMDQGDEADGMKYL
jgi:hypothetical protein